MSHSVRKYRRYRSPGDKGENAMRMGYASSTLLVCLSHAFLAFIFPCNFSYTHQPTMTPSARNPQHSR